MKDLVYMAIGGILGALIVSLIAAEVLTRIV